VRNHRLRTITALLCFALSFSSYLPRKDYELSIVDKLFSQLQLSVLAIQGNQHRDLIWCLESSPGFDRVALTSSRSSSTSERMLHGME